MILPALYQRGDLLPVAWVPTSGSSVVLSVRGWTLDKFVALFDVTHTGHGGAGTARLTGKGDASCNTTFSYDANVTFTAMGITAGVNGFLTAFFKADGSQFQQEPMVIEKIGTASSVDKELQISVDLKENVNVGIPVSRGL